MAKHLAVQGYERSYIQVREKINQLKHRYKKVMDNNNRSGSGRKTCLFFKELHDLLSDRPITNPPRLLDSFDSNGDEGRSLENAIVEVNENDDSFSISDTTQNLETGSNSSGEAGKDENPSKPNEANKEVEEMKKKPEERRLSQKHGKSKKRTRHVTFLSEICNMIQEQQKQSDD
eukprot:gene1154-521_t